MNNPLQHNIVEGKHVNEWVNTPYGAFHEACKKNGIKLVYGDASREELKTYKASIRFTFTGYGYETIEVQAASEEEATKKAMDIANKKEFDCDGQHAEVDDFELRDIEEVEE